jgi:glycosyltransferase involved in cell wall biosynthesis
MIVFPFAGETTGGSLHSGLLLVEGLLRDNFRVLTVFHGPGIGLETARRRGLPCLELPPLGRKRENIDRADAFRAGNLLSLPHALAALRSTEAILVHLNEKRMIRTWALPTKLMSVPTIAHWRGTYTRSLSVAFGMRQTKRIICISEYAKSTLPRWARSKSIVVSNPIAAAPDQGQLSRMRREIRTKIGLSDDVALIGCFGNFSERKRPHFLLDILERIRLTADGRPVHGLLCGEPQPPHDQHLLTMLRRTDWSARLIMPGYVTDVFAWMTACDVLIAPSVAEPWGRTAAEAQSIGLPAIVAADSGLKEVVQHGVSGLSIDPYQLGAWVDAVREVLDHPRFAAILATGGLAAAKGRSVESHVNRIKAIYADVLGARFALVRAVDPFRD